MNETGKIIQWNCQGFRTKKDELLNICRTIRPAIIAIQETMCRDDYQMKIPNFNCIQQQGHINRRVHGGVAVFVHESIPFQQLQLNTDLQSTAIIIQLSRRMTVCSLYNSRSHDLSEAALNHLLQQLPPPVLLLGDFNSYSTLWGSNTTDARGTIIESFIASNNLMLLNNGCATRIGLDSETAIDLSICSPNLAADCQWQVLPSPRDSDHCPILVDIVNNNPTEPSSAVFRNHKKTNWDTYVRHPAWHETLDEDEISQQLPEDLITDIYSRFNAAMNDAVPAVRRSRFYPKVWWGVAVQKTFNEREKAYKAYRTRKSPQNFLLWKICRAKHRQAVKHHKRESWRKMASELNCNTPLAKVWENIRRIKGKTTRKIPILRHENRMISSPVEICDKLAENFCKVSNNYNYNIRFQGIKQLSESTPIDFSSNNREPYNQPFSHDELIYALRSTKNGSPGEDEITHNMIKNLPSGAMLYLLNIINRIFSSHYFPPQWSKSVIIPIPKPNKDHSAAENYRPISLTSVLCKTMERMVNNRLNDYLETIPDLYNIQCGGLKKRSTIDHLVNIEGTIRKAFANGEHVVSVFFDLQKAYDTTWRHGILKDLYNVGMRGHLPMFIKNFLRNRTFNVRLGNNVSSTQCQETGIPQGSVLSVSLFILKIDGISKRIPNDPRFTPSLYVDDLQLSYSHSDLNVIRRKLQSTINNIATWAADNGYSFSTSKTFAIHFKHLAGLHLNPPLRIDNQLIPYKSEAKFLGLTLDSKMTWKPHVTRLRNECSKAMNILKSIASTDWGADQGIMMHLYRALVRSRLDYGAIVYGSASNEVLKPLNAIANEAIRIATGAYRSSPVCSLQVIVNEKPLDIRRDMLTLKYYFKMRAQLSNPGRKTSVVAQQQLLYNNLNMIPPLANRAEKLLAEYNIQKGFVRPNFSYSMIESNIPTWLTRSPNIRRNLTIFPKATTTAASYRQAFLDILFNNYYDHQHIYTDGSKTRSGVGAAAVSGNVVKRATLPAQSSIATAELYAINMATEIIKESQSLKFVIFTDSLANLEKIKDKYSENTLQRKLIHTFNDFLSRGVEVELCWIPGHAGIQGNERADSEAKTAAGGIPVLIPAPYTDHFKVVEESIKEKWQDRWNRSGAKLFEIHRQVKPWNEKILKRKDQVKINRLRIGHTDLTHSYLFDPDIMRPPPGCPLCFEATLTVKHVLSNCNALADARQRHFDTPNPTIEEILKEDMNSQRLLNFLHSVGLYNLL